MTRSEILQGAKPIPLNEEMVLAILDGRKTAIRRIVEGAPKNTYRVEPVDLYGDRTVYAWNFLYGVPLSDGGYADMYATIKPNYQKGNILYVKETWAKQQGLYWHKAGLELDDAGRAYGCVPPEKWHLYIHMPKEAARVFLRVTDLKAERLKDITEIGAKAEGAVKAYPYIDPRDDKRYLMESKDGTYKCGFSVIWDSTIKPKYRGKYGWAANPWVWVIEFEKLEVETL